MRTIKIECQEADGVEVTLCRGLKSDGAGGLVPSNDIEPPERATGGTLAQPQRLALPWLGVEGHTLQSQPLPPRQLGGGYRGGETSLDIADAATLRGDYLRAYRRIVAGAAAGGGFVAPILARVVLYGFGGERLREGPPVLLTPTQAGVFGAQAAEYSLSTGGLAEGGVIRSQSYRVVMHWPAEASTREWLDKVASAGVEFSPQLHAVDGDGWCQARVSSGDGQNLTLRLSAPGMSLTSASNGTPWWRHQVGLMLGRFDIEAYEGARFDASDMRARTIDNIRPDDALTEQDGVSKHLHATLDSITTAEQALRTPHNFTAATSCVNGTAIAYGGVRPVSFEGYSAQEYAVAQGYVSSLLAYPDGRCSGLNVDGRRVALTPTADGRWAWYLDDNLQGIQATTVEADLSNIESTQPGEGLLGVAALTDPLRLTAMAELPAAAVALVTSVRSRSSWDFGRRHFYAFTPKGIHALMLSADNRKLDSSIIDSRGVDNPRLVAPGEGGVYACAGETLVKVSGSAVTTLATLWEGIESVKYDPTAGSIWVSGGSRKRVYGRCPGRWHEPSVGDIKWSMMVEGAPERHIRGIDFRMSGKNFTGHVVVRLPSGRELARYRLDGPCKGIGARLAVPFRRQLEVMVEGRASSDFRLHELRISI